MANWITHTIIADKLLERGRDLDQRGFTVGNIAPDCNIENDDWTAFVPPKAVTHFMRGESKVSSDLEGFYGQYIEGKTFDSKEHHSFLLGYYSHLVTDAEYQKFIRDEKRVRDSFERIKSNDEMSRQIEGYPHNFDTLKKVFGKWAVFSDIIALENQYLLDHPECTYNRVLRTEKDFPDYLDFFPQNAFNRKIPIMLREYDEWAAIKGSGFYFFSEEEYENYINQTSEMIYNQLLSKF